MSKSDARDRLEACLTKIADPKGEGQRAFLKLYADEARASADAADARARFGHKLSPLDGRIISIKDLFDVAGETTMAGSVVYADAAKAPSDAPIVQRLRAAGAVIIGKTNMTEFAFSGVGINPHYGTPGNPANPACIPGGSSSGAAVAAGSHMCEISIGSDTGGSVRIPAALCGIAGFKPTQHRVTRDGAVPLSLMADSIGPLAHNVADLVATDAVMADAPATIMAKRDVRGLRLAIPRGRLLESLDAAVAAAFERTVVQLAKAGAHIVDLDISPLLADFDAIMAQGSIYAVEAAWFHTRVLRDSPDRIDHRVVERINAGSKISGAVYCGLLEARKLLVRKADAVFAPIDAIILPTVAITAPKIADLEKDDATFWKNNGFILRNTTPFNYFDCPGLSLPIPDAGPMPVGLMLMGRRNSDASILALGAGVEAVLAGH